MGIRKKDISGETIGYAIDTNLGTIKIGDDYQFYLYTSTGNGGIAIFDDVLEARRYRDLIKKEWGKPFHWTKIIRVVNSGCFCKLIKPWKKMCNECNMRKEFKDRK